MRKHRCVGKGDCRRTEEAILEDVGDSAVDDRREGKKG